MGGIQRDGVSVASVAIDCNALFDEMRKAVLAEEEANLKAIAALEKYNEAVAKAGQSTARRTQAQKDWVTVYDKRRRALPAILKARKEWEEFADSNPEKSDKDAFDRELERLDHAVELQDRLWDEIVKEKSKVDLAESAAAKDDAALKEAQGNFDRAQSDWSRAADEMKAAIEKYRSQCGGGRESV